MNFALSIPKSAEYSAEDLFYGCLAAMLTLKKAKLSEWQLKVSFSGLANIGHASEI
jgi:hypothetical protein